MQNERDSLGARAWFFIGSLALLLVVGILAYQLLSGGDEPVRKSHTGSLDLGAATQAEDASTDPGRAAGTAEPTFAAAARVPAKNVSSAEETAEAADSRVQVAARPADDPYLDGLALLSRGEPGEAVEIFRKVLEAKPEHVPCRVNLARALLADQQPHQALVEALKAERLDETNPAAIRVVGRCRHELGQADLAAKAYLRAIRLDHDDAWAMNNLGLVRIEQQRFDLAVYPLARAAQLLPGERAVQNNLGVALERTGHYAAAEAAYRAAVAADSTDARVLANLRRVTPLLARDVPFDLALAAAGFVKSLEVETASAEGAVDDLSHRAEETARP